MKFQYIPYHYYIIAYSSNPETIISFPLEFATDFSNFNIDPKFDKYLSNSSNLPLSAWQDKAPRPKVKNEDKEDIKNLFDFN